MFDDPYDLLIGAGLSFLSFRPRSKKELLTHLNKKAEKMSLSDTSIMDRVVTRLTELGYVDDVKFAKWFIGQRVAHRQKGERALRFELSEKGVERGDCDKAFFEAKEQGDWDQGSVIRPIALKLARRMAHKPIENQKMLLTAGLLRRGFPGDLVHTIVDEVLTNR